MMVKRGHAVDNGTLKLINNNELRYLSEQRKLSFFIEWPENINLQAM